MKSNELINYLNSIDASVKNKHQDFKIDKYNLSVVLFEITTTTSMEVEFKYKVSIIANKDDSNISWGNISCATFENNQSANNYYNKLIKFVSEASVDDIKNLLHDK